MFTAISTFLKGILPSVFGALGTSDKVREIEAQAHLEEAKALKKRISPRYLMQYCLVLLLTLGGLGWILHWLMPTVFTGAPMKDEIISLARVVSEIIGSW